MKDIFKTFVCPNCDTPILTVSEKAIIYIYRLCYECPGCGANGSCEHIVRDARKGGGK